MPNLAQTLKEEISRLARKEVKSAVGPVKAEVVKLKKANAELKRQVAELQKESKMLAKAEAKRAADAPAPEAEVTNRAYMSGKGVRSLRKKLKVSQADFGKLVGVTPMTVYNWERQDGKLKIRNAAVLPRIIELKGVGVKEVRKRLDA